VRTSLGGNDCFIRRYDFDGTPSWTMTFGGGGDDDILGIVALAPDDIVVVGSFQGAVDFGSTTVPDIRQAKGGADIFVRHITR